MRDDSGKPLLLIVCAVPINPLQHITNKISRLLEENIFIRKQSNNYATLTPRERELMRLIAMGKSNKEISSEMFISVNTTETHRKNIKAKLKVSSTFELNQFASAFDMIEAKQMFKDEL
jgi:DNA-binding CsgD family transcriptional regulator